jgi:hypothetical protein
VDGGHNMVVAMSTFSEVATIPHDSTPLAFDLDIPSLDLEPSWGG